MTTKGSSDFTKKVVTLADGRELIYYNFPEPNVRPEATQNQKFDSASGQKEN